MQIKGRCQRRDMSTKRQLAYVCLANFQMRITIVYLCHYSAKKEREKVLKSGNILSIHAIMGKSCEKIGRQAQPKACRQRNINVILHRRWAV